MKLGKLPARKNSVSFRFRDYLSVSTLPSPPARAGHQNLIVTWGMLGNDQYGDCVLAGGDHETMLWNKEASKTVNFSPDTALADYGAITGFNKNDPSSDQGTDMATAASYRRKTGLIDANGKRHTVSAYLAITPGNKLELKQAIELFSNVGIGIQFPSSAMDQFHAGRPWSVVSGSSIEGGHYVPAVGYDSKYVYVITWGKVQKMTWSFFTRYCDEAIVYLSQEFLTGGKSPEGFDAKTLQANLAQLK